jgi:hypothetical protein
VSIHKVMVSLLGLFAGLAVSLIAIPAEAQSCSVTTASVNFGAVNLLNGAVVNGSGTVSVNCVNLLSLTTRVRLCINIAGERLEPVAIPALPGRFPHHPMGFARSADPRVADGGRPHAAAALG